MSNDFCPAPKGLNPDEILDPQRIHEDLARLMGVASKSTQQQWEEGAFPDENVMAEGAPVRIREAKVQANLYQETWDSATARMTGQNNPVIRPHASTLGATWTADPNLFQIPYNRGLQPVADQRIEWTSTYPELLWIIQDLQYLRERWNTFGYGTTGPDYEGTTEYHIRFKARLAVDGAMLPGTGPEVQPINTRYRGSGFANRGLRTNLVGMQMVPAGSHVVQLFVGQGPSDPTADFDHLVETDKELPYDPEPPTQGVVLAHRSLIVVSFPLGLPLGG